MDSMELPEDVREQLAGFEAAVASVEHGLEPLLQADRRELEAALSPVERAKVHVTLANAVTTLFCMYLKTVGLDPADHAVARELERVELYRAKVDRAGDGHTDGAGGRDRRAPTLDVAAAKRFIEHGADLTAAQKGALRAAGGAGAGGSAAEDAEAFLDGMQATPSAATPAGGAKRKSTGGTGGKSGASAKKGRGK